MAPAGIRLGVTRYNMGVKLPSRAPRSPDPLSCVPSARLGAYALIVSLRYSLKREIICRGVYVNPVGLKYLCKN